MNSKVYKSSAVFLILMMLSISCFSMQDISGLDSENFPAIIPAPQHLVRGEKFFSIPKKNTICYDSESEKSVLWIKKLLAATKYDVALQEGENCGNWNLQINKNLHGDLGDEGYKLQVNAAGVHIISATEAGMFYGIQTLRQLFPSEVEAGNLDSEIRLRFV